VRSNVCVYAGKESTTGRHQNAGTGDHFYELIELPDLNPQPTVMSAG
jgi:hypothetical protein